MKKIILGSSSPRRKELLAALGFDFEVIIKEIDESCPVQIPLAERAQYIANKKADAFNQTLKDDEILICADTVVICDDKMLNKPNSVENAVEMLSMLSGKTHQVITGVVIKSNKTSNSFSVETLVTFNEISIEEINNYIQKFKPLDKAGAYGIQEWIGYAFISKIEGEFSNVVGLPTSEVYRTLIKML